MSEQRNKSVLPFKEKHILNFGLNTHQIFQYGNFNLGNITLLVKTCNNSTK